MARKNLNNFAENYKKNAKSNHYTNAQQDPAPPKCFLPTPRTKVIEF
jgi:hypothetical protein